MERKVGEIFEFDGKRLQVVEQDTCKNCYFDDDDICRHDDIDKIGNCCDRHDRKEIIFKEV